MTTDPVEIECRGETLRLFAEHAAYWVGERLLLVADLHVGKTATFRAAGMPVPEGGLVDDLARLDRLIAAAGAEKLVILGDLFHAGAGMTPSVRRTFSEALDRWRPVEVTLVPGNHDRSVGMSDFPRIRIVEESVNHGPFVFTHDASPVRGGGYAIGGHVHPAVRIREGNASFRVPCFWFGVDYAVLPAFGNFTGTHLISPDEDDRVFATVDGRISELPSSFFR